MNVGYTFMAWIAALAIALLVVFYHSCDRQLLPMAWTIAGDLNKASIPKCRIKNVT